MAGTAAGPARSGLAMFSAADGHLLRWLLRGKPGLAPVAVSAGRRWVYYNTAAGRAHAYCAHNGYTEPVLWRVSTRGRSGSASADQRWELLGWSIAPPCPHGPSPRRLHRCRHRPPIRPATCGGERGAGGKQVRRAATHP